jgi:hypothetical protein
MGSNRFSRRNAIKCAGLAGAAVVTGAQRRGATSEEAIRSETPKYAPTLGAPHGMLAQVVDPQLLKPTETEDNQVVTVLFGGDLSALQVALEPKSADVMCKVAMLEIPFSPPTLAGDAAKRFYGFNVLLRGHVMKDRDVRVVMTLNLAATSHRLEFDYGCETDESIDQRYCCFLADGTDVKIVSKTEVVDGKTVEKLVRELRYNPGPPRFSAVLVVNVERRNGEAQALASLEELEVSIIRPVQPGEGAASS